MEGSKIKDKGVRVPWGAVCFLAILVLIVTLIVPYSICLGLRKVPPQAEILLPLLVIAGVIGLLASLTIVIIVLAALNLSDSSGAFGLPKGSFRAIIALSLILIFAITSTFLYNTLDPDTNPEKVKFAQQILTTVSTLVVTVVGFYFGARAVEQAHQVVEQPSLRILNPDSPVVLDVKPGTELSIRIEARPRGSSVFWEPPQGDDDGALVQVKLGEFKYIRGSKADPAVTLRFCLVDYPHVTAELTVKHPP